LLADRWCHDRDALGLLDLSAGGVIASNKSKQDFCETGIRFLVSRSAAATVFL
jgi:hypothetical protein